MSLNQDERKRLDAATAAFKEMPGAGLNYFATQHGVTVSTLRRELMLHGLLHPMRQGGRLSQEERDRRDEIVREYKKGDSINALARKHKLSYSALYNELVDHGKHVPWERLVSVTDLPADAAARLPLATKRRINAEIGDHFDPELGRYSAGFSDQEIATRYDVPWAAVQQIRVENWGDLRDDTSLEALRIELSQIRLKISSFEHTDFDALLEECRIKITETERALKELRDWYDMAVAEREKTNSNIVQLKSEVQRVADQLGEWERRRG